MLVKQIVLFEVIVRTCFKDMAAGLRASLTTASAMSEFMQRVGPIEYPRQVGGLRVRGFSARRRASFFLRTIRNWNFD